MIGLVGLEDDAGGGEVAAPDAADDLGEEFEGAFFGREVGQGQPGVGLDDANGGEVREVKAARQGLSADEQINFAGFDRSIEVREAFGTPIVSIETGEFSLREQTAEFGGEELGADAFVDDTGMMTFGTGSGDIGGMTANVTAESIVVSVKRKREITIRTERLPAAFFT